ncbi:SAM-dependent methyltransferase [Kitasatospora sp. NPDC092948]|uniref:SAM-dependent methyltransferase n=1 Tax=Kitasatospora sp. NPDC092948 TaxID=3364088 RepID=UPI0038059FD5
MGVGGVAEGAGAFPQFDPDRPSVARMHDWLLDGRNNYDSDRLAGEELLRIAPGARELARSNRAFLVRVVRHIATRYGIRQFLDHGSGLPTRKNVHQVAQAVHRDCKVVYIDNDPMVLSYGRALLDENPNVTILPADLVDTAKIRAGVQDRIDFSRPVAALFVSVLHCLPDSKDPRAVIERTVRQLAEGSVVVACQLVSGSGRIRRQVTDLMTERTGGRWGQVRTEEEVRRFFDIDRLTVQAPGLLDVARWEPDSAPPTRRAAGEWVEFGGLATVE